MTKWSWSLKFFTVFLATGFALVIIGAVLLALYAFGNSLLVGTLTVLGEICVASLFGWAIAEELGS